MLLTSALMFVFSYAVFKNYGKRLMFQVDVAHPANYYLSRLIKEKPQLNIPADPRDFIVGGIEFNQEKVIGYYDYRQEKFTRRKPRYKP